MALTGASRGAEQASLLASLLGRAAKTDSTILVPDALYASAPYGRVVGAFNWRRNPEDERWQKTRTLWEDCRDSRAPACDRRPALEPSECWVDDPTGGYQGPDGRRRSWVTSRCAAEPNRPGQIFDRPAWRWNLDSDSVNPGTEINLADYSGPILVVHGAVDPIWSVEAGPDHLRRTLSRHSVRSHRQTVPKYQHRIRSWPTLPKDRVFFYIFDGEPHLFSTWGAVARRRLFLKFLESYLGRPQKKLR